LGKKAFEVKGASSMSRRQMWTAAYTVALHLKDETIATAICPPQTYDGVKADALLARRKMVKDEVRQTALTGWVRNEGDSDFSIALNT
jgi:tRNA-specific adenosine deaminase 1